MKNNKIKIFRLSVLIVFGIISCSKTDESDPSLSKNEMTAKEIGKYHNISLKKVEKRLEKLIENKTSSGILYTRAYLDQIESDEIHNFVMETEPELG